MTDSLQTHSSCVTFSYPSCSLRPWYMNSGPHHASAPATNDTHVKPAVDNMKLLLKLKTLRHQAQWLCYTCLCDLCTAIKDSTDSTQTCAHMPAYSHGYGYVCMCTYAHGYGYVYMCTHTWLWICVYVHIHTWLWICVCAHTHMVMDMCICAHTHVVMDMCICAHTHMVMDMCICAHTHMVMDVYMCTYIV
jgi:hypothetical protein